MKRAALFALLLAGCFGEFEPAFELEPGVHKIHAQDRVWLDMRGDFSRDWTHVPNLLQESPEESGLRVYWTRDTECPYRPERNAIVLENGRCVAGVLYSCREIYVARDRDNPDRTCGTALAHEYGHCLSGLAGWGFDGDHSNVEFWDWVQDKRREQCQVSDW